MTAAGTTRTPVVEQANPTVRTVTLVQTTPAPTAKSQRIPVSVVILAALILIGGGIRLPALLADRCLWIDEAMLALNLINRAPQELLKPLDYNQGAPVGFLLAVKAVISLFGAAEWSLRLVPFTASILGLFGIAWVARRLLSANAAILAVTLFAFSPQLVSYAGECKQYASDAAIAVGLLAVALGLLEGRSGLARWLALTFAGAVAVWCSHPATFVLGGIGSAILLHAAITRDRKRFLAASLTVAGWLASFAVCYVLCLKQLGGNKYLIDYWTDHFLPLPPTKFGDITWIGDHLVAFFTIPGGFGGTLIPLGGFAAVLAFIGLREFARERWPVAMAFITTVLLVLLASGLRKYPFGGRLLLFLVPFTVLLVARGAWAVYEAIRERNRFAAIALLGLLVVTGVWQTLDVIRRPLRQEELKPLLEGMRPQMQPGDRVYVYYSSEPAFRFYTRSCPFPADSVTFGEEYRDDPAGFRAELSTLRGRVWVIFSHPHSQEETFTRTVLDSRGTCEQELKRPGAAVWLYRLE